MTTYTLVYPPSQDATYVKSTTQYDVNYHPYFATNPAKSLTGSWQSNSWVAQNAVVTNQRFHIDLGEGKIVRRIYYENAHHIGGLTDAGVKNFTLWGSNIASAFAELTYGTDTNWTQLTTAQSTFDQHSASDAADPKYILVTNSTAYRYYAFKFADNYGNASYMGARRISLMTEDGYLPVVTLTVADMTLAQIIESLSLTQHNILSVQNMTLAQIITYPMFALLVNNIVLGMYLDNVPNPSLPKLKTLGIKEYNFPTIEKGDSFEWETNLTDDMGNILLGLTAATISCIVKSPYDHSVLVDFSSKFTLTSGTGKLSFNLTPADTGAITWSKGIYWLKINYASGITRTIQYGEMPVDLG
jgi:hypothetical protein